MKAKDLNPKALAKNIVAVYMTASTDEALEGLSWYANALKSITSIAEELGFTAETLCGVVAAISPGLRWQRNIWWAKELAYAWKNGEAELLKVPTYSYANVVKAIRILNGESPLEVLRGPKVRAFYQLLIVGGKDIKTVCVDGHACCIAVNKRAGIRTENKDGFKVPTINAAKFNKIAEAYRIAARQLSLYPSQVQAVTWVTWRNRYLNSVQSEIKPKKTATASA